MPDALRRQLGPFPLGVWLVIVTAGVALGVALNRRAGSTEEAPELVPDDKLDPYAGGTGAGQPAYRGATVLPAAPPASSANDYTEPPTSNDDWLAQGVKLAIVGENSPSPLAAMEALNVFLAGGQLTSAQRGIVNRVVGKLGPPPYGVTMADAGGGQVPTPTTPWTPPSGGGGAYVPPVDPGRQQVLDIFDRYGLDPSYTESGSTDAGARVDRIARELASGTRTPEQVAQSVRRLAEIDAGTYVPGSYGGHVN